MPLLIVVPAAETLTVVDDMVLRSIASLNVTVIAAFREILVEFAAGEFEVTVGEVVSLAGVGVGVAVGVGVICVWAQPRNVREPKQIRRATRRRLPKYFFSILICR